MLELHYPTLKVAFGNGNVTIFENSLKLYTSFFVTSRWPRSSGQTYYQVHHHPHPPELFTLEKVLQLSADHHARWPPCKLWEHRFSDQTSSLPPREARNTCERKQAKWLECLPRERLVQGEKHAGKEALLGVLDPTFTVSKTLQQWNTIPKSAGTKKLKAMNMLKQRPRP